MSKKQITTIRIATVRKPGTFCHQIVVPISIVEELYRTGTPMITGELQSVNRRSFHPRSHIGCVLYIFTIGIRTIVIFILVKFYLSFQIGIAGNGGTVCINAIATFYT